MKNNSIIVDLNKVQFGYHYWRNQYGQTSKKKLKFSVRGIERDPNDRHLNGTDTLKEYGDRHKLTDVWTEEVKLQLSANHQLTYTGTKAKQLWKAWGEKIFKK